MFRFGEKKEEVEIEAVEEVPIYSVLIHFAKRVDYVYYIKDTEIYSNNDGTVYFTAEVGENLEIGGEFVFRNNFETKEQAEEFVSKYKLVNPVVMEY